MNEELRKEIKAVVRDEARHIIGQNMRMRVVLEALVNDLPKNRDWLDPVVEREARALLKEPVDLDAPQEDGRMVKLAEVKGGAIFLDRGPAERPNPNVKAPDFERQNPA